MSDMEIETLNAQARDSLPSPDSSPLGRGRGEGSQIGRRAGDEGAQREQTIAGFSLSRWERVVVRVRPVPNVAEILSA